LFVSFEDEILLRNVRGVARLLKARIGRSEVSSTPFLRGLFRLAQRRSETRDRRNRESVLRQDDWIEQNLPGIG
jgi:preprotein translocase subunit SecA